MGPQERTGNEFCTSVGGSIYPSLLFLSTVPHRCPKGVSGLSLPSPAHSLFVPDRYSLNKPLDHSVLSWHLLLGEPELSQRVTHGLSGAASCWAIHQAGLGKQDLPREPQASHSSLSKEAHTRPLDFISLIWLEAWQSRLDFLMSHIICGIKDVVLTGRERKILVTSAA